MTSSEKAFAEVARTFVRSARMLDRVDSGLTLPQYRLLTLLDAGDERSTALAQRLAVSKPAISTAVDVLTGLGHIRRKADNEDRRSSWLQITDSGQVALRRADQAYAKRLKTVAARMESPSRFLSTIADFAAALDRDLAEARSRSTSSPTDSIPPKETAHQ